MKKIKALVAAAVLAGLLALLTGCGPVVGTVTGKYHEPAHTYHLQGFRTHTRTVPYSSTCTRTSTTTSGKSTSTRTSTYPCTRYRSETYQQYDYWTEFQPECWRFTLEVTDKDGDRFNTTRCVPASVWARLQVGDTYDSDKDRA